MFLFYLFLITQSLHLKLWHELVTTIPSAIIICRELNVRCENQKLTEEARGEEWEIIFAQMLQLILVLSFEEI